MYRFTCDICGQVMEGEDIDGVVQTARSHMINSHGMQKGTDVTQPNIAYEEDELRERIEEVD